MDLVDNAIWYQYPPEGLTSEGCTISEVTTTHVGQKIPTAEVLVERRPTHVDVSSTAEVVRTNVPPMWLATTSEEGTTNAVEKVMTARRTTRRVDLSWQVVVILLAKGSPRSSIMIGIKMRSHLRKESVAYLAPIVDKEVKEKRIQDFPVVRDYTEVFPEELPGLPPHRQVEFHIKTCELTNSRS
ncbi:hypothetical protein OSB04_011542 [Centaurea solstitialis]|uniref:Uncharacterized protein n=1 Tax=Centaurea solstitialis TaxID=347529 RepID=A0AA38TUD5_9ASTR|nr:hypothetical protein OSB04_011542 [Centaurea solstitialis]